MLLFNHFRLFVIKNSLNMFESVIELESKRWVENSILVDMSVFQLNLSLQKKKKR